MIGYGYSKEWCELCKKEMYGFMYSVMCICVESNSPQRCNTSEQLNNAIYIATSEGKKQTLFNKYNFNKDKN